MERVVKEAVNDGDTEKIQLIIKQLRNDYAYAVHQPNARYGGLIGLAAVAIALGQNEVPPYLESIMHPVLACFGDQDPMVRYFACEALYNIAKVSKGEILVYFNEIFDVLCKLVADPEMSVKNAADILDRLIKDIVSEKAATYVSVLADPAEKPAAATLLDPRTGKTLQVYQPQVPKAFSLPKFIPLLKERMYATNPYTRMFLVSWLRLLDSIPDLEMISYVPSFLDPLFSYLSSSLEDVRVVTENFLKLLLHEIKGIYEIKSSVKDATDGLYIPGQDVVIDCPKIIDILINNLDSTEEPIQLMALQWLWSLLKLSPESFVIFMPKLLSVILTTISHSNSQLQAMAVQFNSKLMELAASRQDEINYTLILNQLTLQFLNDKESTRLAVLDWLIMLHDENPQKFLEHSDNIFSLLLKALNDSSEKVIDKDLELLSKISNQSDDKYFQSFMIDLIDLFKKDRKLLDTRADFIIRTICKSLDSERVYKSISRVLSDDESNLNFVSIMIQILNNNLIVAPELQDLRRKLTKGDSASLFETLFRCWSLNSPSLLCLTLLTSKYKLSWQIVSQMANYDISLNLLIQLDLLIQLMESPVFIRLRLDLLNPHKNSYLLKCLYGLLMLLPQSNSFKLLQNRLSAIMPVATLQLEDDDNASLNTAESDSEQKLLDTFNNSQKRWDEYVQEDHNETTAAAIVPRTETPPPTEDIHPLDTSSAIASPERHSPERPPPYLRKASAKNVN